MCRLQQSSFANIWCISLNAFPIPVTPKYLLNVAIGAVSITSSCSSFHIPTNSIYEKYSCQVPFKSIPFTINLCRLILDGRSPGKKTVTIHLVSAPNYFIYPYKVMEIMQNVVNFGMAGWAYEWNMT